MSTGIPSRVLRCSVSRTDNLITFMRRFSRNSGSLNLLEPKGPVQACNELALLSYVKNYLFYYLSNHYCFPLSAGMNCCEVAFVLL